ncbi:hypothetical protein ABT269_37170 [Streptomyces viridosporus]|uniref:hypothetical protein n=1 Tax=Streptomyces viridosporus TaxID=67581 RepID=UPI003322D43F
MNDDVPFRFEEPTNPERAHRARTAFEVYHLMYGGEVSDLAADLLHLAEVDELPGGAQETARYALLHYTSAPETWPAAPPRTPPAYLAQFRPRGREDWITAAQGNAPRPVTERLWRLLQNKGYESSQIPRCVDDLVRGAVLTAKDGTRFRTIPHPQA